MSARARTISTDQPQILRNLARNRQEVRLEKIPFDETSKYLDSFFDGEKETILNKQFHKHARDQYKCFCQICLQNNPNLLQYSPQKLNSSFASPNRSLLYSNKAFLSPNKMTLSTAKQNNSMSKTMYSPQQEKQIIRLESISLEKNEEISEPTEQTDKIAGTGNTVEDQQSKEDQVKNHDTELCFVLRRLLPPARVTRTLRILLPETVIFWNGKARLLVYTNQKDGQIKFIKSKDKLQFNEIRKFFNERRIKYKQSIEQKLEEQRIFGVNESRYVKRTQDIRQLDSPSNKSTGSQQFSSAVRRASGFLKSANTKKSNYFNSANKTPLQSPSQENSNNVGAIDSQSSRPRANSKSSEAGNAVAVAVAAATAVSSNFASAPSASLQAPVFEKESKDAVIYKVDSTSKYDPDHTMIINETDFLILMMKRKIDQVWFNIHYLQNVMKVKRSKFEFQHHHFCLEELKNDELFNRAFKDTQIINGEISSVSSEYILPESEEEFETKMMYEQVTDYQKYMVCKIFHTIQTFHGVTIEQMDTEWLQDDIGQLFLINCKNIISHEEGRSYITTEMYFKKIEEKAEKRLELKEGMEEKYKDYRKEAIDLFSSAMLDSYEKKKQNLGIVKAHKSRQEGEISDEVFAQIYPSIQFKLSDLLKTNAPIKVLQQEIMGEQNQTLKDQLHSRNSQMFSHVYSSPPKIKTEIPSLNSTISMRETFSLMSRTNPSKHRGFSAHTPGTTILLPRQYVNQTEMSRLGNADYQDTSDYSSNHHPKIYDSPMNRINSQAPPESNTIIYNSPPTKRTVKHIPAASSTSKKIKKRTLPYFLFSSPQS